MIQATLKRCQANRKKQHNGTGRRRQRRRQNGRRRQQQHRGRILLHIIVVRDCWHRNPPWLIGSGLVQLGRHRKTTCNGDEYDDGGGVVTTTTTTENEDGVFSIVVGNGRPPMGHVAPLTNVRTPLHALSNWSAVSHFVAPLICVHVIYVFLLLTYTFSHSHETLTLPSLLP